MYRRIRTFSETRSNANPDHAPFVRGTRRNLPSRWFGIAVGRSTSWKDNSRRSAQCRDILTRNVRQELQEETDVD